MECSGPYRVEYRVDFASDETLGNMNKNTTIALSSIITWQVMFSDKFDQVDLTTYVHIVLLSYLLIG